MLLAFVSVFSSLNGRAAIAARLPTRLTGGHVRIAAMPGGSGGLSGPARAVPATASGHLSRSALSSSTPGDTSVTRMFPARLRTGNLPVGWTTTPRPRT